MGFWDKIKSWLGINKPKALPEGQKTQENNQTICLTREDGTSITITPRYGRGNVPICKTVVDKYSGQIHQIPEYTIEDDAIKETQLARGSDMTKILMEINYEELLNNEEYRYQMANVLLSQQRLVQAIDETNGYAGGMRMDQEGKPVPTRNSGIALYLQASQEEQNEMYTSAIAKNVNMGERQVLSQENNPFLR